MALRTRTRLTTPPGQDPQPAGEQPDAASRASTVTADADERYVPGLALPDEPRVRSRWFKPLVVMSSIVVVLGILYAILLAATQGQYLDPALDEDVPGQPAPVETDDPVLEAPDEG